MIRFQRKTFSDEGVELAAEYLKKEFRDEKEAVEFIEKHINDYDHHDYNREYGYWWGRNEGPQHLLHKFWRV